MWLSSTASDLSPIQMLHNITCTAFPFQNLVSKSPSTEVPLRVASSQRLPIRVYKSDVNLSLFCHTTTPHNTQSPTPRSSEASFTAICELRFLKLLSCALVSDCLLIIYVPFQTSPGLNILMHKLSSQQAWQMHLLEN